MLRDYVLEGTVVDLETNTEYKLGDGLEFFERDNQKVAVKSGKGYALRVREREDESTIYTIELIEHVESGSYGKVLFSVHALLRDFSYTGSKEL